MSLFYFKYALQNTKVVEKRNEWDAYFICILLNVSMLLKTQKQIERYVQNKWFVLKCQHAAEEDNLWKLFENY